MEGLNAVKIQVHVATHCFQNSQNKAETEIWTTNTGTWTFSFFLFYPPLTFSPDLTNRAHLTSDFPASYSILSFLKESSVGLPMDTFI